MLLEKWHRLTCSKQGCHKPAICKKCIICKVQYKEVCLLFMVPLSTTPNRLNSPSSWFPRMSTKEYWYLEGRDNSCNLKLTEKLLCNHLLIYLKMPLALPLSSTGILINVLLEALNSHAGGPLISFVCLWCLGQLLGLDCCYKESGWLHWTIKKHLLKRKKEQSFRDLWDYKLRSNIHTIGMPRRRGKRAGLKKYSKK